MKKKYINPVNIPPSLGLLKMLWTAASLKVFNAPGWIWGVLGTFFVLSFVFNLVKLITCDPYDIFDYKDK